MGGNIFDSTSSILKENIDPTLYNYFKLLSKNFPKKQHIFNDTIFSLVGSAKKKDESGDIDIAIDLTNIIKDQSEQSVNDWNLHLDDVITLAYTYFKRSRTSTYDDCFNRAVLTLISQQLETVNIGTNIKKVTSSNIFTSFQQYNSEGPINKWVQIDWMIGDKDLLMFSYFSKNYDQNVKGLHRTQALLAMFNVLGYSFNHTKGLVNKSNDKHYIKPNDILKQLSLELNVDITQNMAEDYFVIHNIFKSSKYYDEWLDIYFKILDSTRCDIPVNIQSEWLDKKSLLGLTGKFLPDDSLLLKQ